jgi:Peptidase family M41
MMLGRQPVVVGARMEHPDRPRPYSRIFVAYHEAGHAVAHCVLDVHFDYVTIVSGGEFLGRVEAADRPPRIPLEAALKRLVVLDAGGRAAEMLTAGRITLEVPREDGGITVWGSGTNHDLSSSVHIIKQLAMHYEKSPQDLAFVLQIWGRAANGAHRILCRHWPEVVRVAESLLAHKTLTAEEVVAAMQART